MAKRRQYIPAKELIPAPYNPRVPFDPEGDDWRALAASIKEHGIIEPIVWNQATGHIIGGHQRYRVAAALGWSRFKVGTEVAVVDIQDLETEKRANLRLNTIGDSDEIWDTEALGELLTELLKGEDSDSVELFGMAPSEVAAVFSGLDLPGPDAGDDEGEGGSVRDRSGSPQVVDTRYVQLYYPEAEYERIVKAIKALKEAWNLDHPAEVCLRAAELAVQAEAKKAKEKKK